jgi:hypothetical protein
MSLYALRYGPLRSSFGTIGSLRSSFGAAKTNTRTSQIQPYDIEFVLAAPSKSQTRTTLVKMVTRLGGQEGAITKNTSW